MTTEEILDWAKRIHYAHVDIGPDFCMHYGKTSWEKQLSELSEEQRVVLMSQIEQWESSLAKTRIR